MGPWKMCVRHDVTGNYNATKGIAYQVVAKGMSLLDAHSNLATLKGITSYTIKHSDMMLLVYGPVVNYAIKYK